MKKVFTVVTSLVLLLALTGCSSSKSRYLEPAAVGGAGGAAAGAATGALVGSMIANGDVIASAWLGAGIGLPLGAALAVYLQMEEEKTTLELNEAIINANQSLILDKQAQLLALRQRVENDLRDLNLDYQSPRDPNEDKLYLGPTIGVYR
jgi:hypothetical protein